MDMLTYFGIDRHLVAWLTPEDGYERPSSVWRFHGWEGHHEYWAQINNAELDVIVRTARNGAALTGARSRQIDRTIFAPSRDMTVSIIYKSLLETYLEFCGFYDADEYAFRLELEAAGTMVEMGFAALLEPENELKEQLTDLPY